MPESVRVAIIFKEGVNDHNDVRTFCSIIPKAEPYMDKQWAFFKALRNNRPEQAPYTLAEKGYTASNIIRRFGLMNRRWLSSSSRPSHVSGLDLVGNVTQGDGLITGGIFVIGPGEQGVLHIDKESLVLPHDADAIIAAVRRMTSAGMPGQDIKR